MSAGPLSSRAARSLAVAVAGLVAGHVLVYRIVAPGALQRAALLQATGHGYLPAALALGVMLAALSAAGAFGLGFRRGTAGDARRRGSLVRWILLPAVAQAAAFLVLEVAERGLAGAPLSSLLGPLLPIGVVLQLLVGAAGGLLLAGLDRAGEAAGRAAAARRSRPRRAPAPHRLRSVDAPPKRLLTGGLAIRGPPPAAGRVTA